MKHSSAFVVALIVFLAVSSIPLPQSVASTPYKERLNVYVAGSSALWFMTFSGINGSAGLSALEAVAGLQWYNITAIKTTSWKSDFQIFGPQGYDLVPTPFIPSQGVFLTVGASSFSSASAAATALDNYLLSAFVSYSNGTGTYTFFSPSSFSGAVTTDLLSYIPSAEGGFADAVSASKLESSLSPIVTLSGNRSSSGFVHTLSVGSISTGALTGVDTPNFLSYFGTSPGFLQAANKSTSSVIDFRFLDAIVNSTDKGAVFSSDISKFTASYSLSLSPGKRVTALNVTVMETPPALLLSRTVDTGVLQDGDNVSVTVMLTNLSNSTGETIVTQRYSDDWWMATHDFKLVSKTNSTFPATTLNPKSEISYAYVLEYNGTSQQRITVPAIRLGYSYTLNDVKYVGKGVSNVLQLCLGVSDADVFAYITTTPGVTSELGQAAALKIVVDNVGTSPASSVMVDGQSVGVLAANGGSSTVSASAFATSLTGQNFSRTYSVTYIDKNGVALNATTNTFQIDLSHSSMQIGFPTLVVGAEVTPKESGPTNLTLTFAVEDPGSASLTPFVGRLKLPTGLACGTVKGNGTSCAAGVVTFQDRDVNSTQPVRSSMQISVTTPENFVVKPATFWTETGNLNLTGSSDYMTIPTGVVLSKTFSPSKLFAGMSSTVLAESLNAGPFNVYNETLSTTVDSFDKLASSAVPSGYAGTVSPGKALNFTYGTTMGAFYGNKTSTTLTATFYFGGNEFTLEEGGPIVSVYHPPSASITTAPVTPEEGKDFKMHITITNPSGINVTDVLYTLPIPSGLSLSNLQGATISGGVLTVDLGSLGPGAKFVANATGEGSSLSSIPANPGSLTFTFEGTSVKGGVSGPGVSINVDVTTRYLIPTAVVVLAMLGTALYIRRKAPVTVPAGQK